jgi:hypothetical protein
MKLAETHYDNRETGCCARFDPDAWSEREVTWRNTPFVHECVRAFMHVPLNFGGAMGRANEAIEAAAAYPADPITLSRHSSPWRTDVYVMTDREVPGADMERLSGTFLTKVFEGPYRDAGRWERDIRNEASAAGRRVEEVFFYYATCPKCAKHFGKNHAVLFAKLTEPAQA